MFLASAASTTSRHRDLRGCPGWVGVRRVGHGGDPRAASMAGLCRRWSARGGRRLSALNRQTRRGRAGGGERADGCYTARFVGARSRQPRRADHRDRRITGEDGPPAWAAVDGADLPRSPDGVLTRTTRLRGVDESWRSGTPQPRWSLRPGRRRGAVRAARSARRAGRVSRDVAATWGTSGDRSLRQGGGGGHRAPSGGRCAYWGDLSPTMVPGRRRCWRPGLQGRSHGDTRCRCGGRGVSVAALLALNARRRMTAVLLVGDGYGTAMLSCSSGRRIWR